MTEYGRYKIQKELGKGNMGVVYQAHDPQIERSVALKVLREDRMVSEDFVLRFVKEAKAIGRLSHPNIVTVYDVGQDHDSIYIAMEYLEGKPFDEVIRGSRLEIKDIIDIGIQVAETLDYAHKKKIVHRDIKPSNMIMNNEGRVKLTDFGIARIEDPSMMQQTQAGEILGTPVYMSPEQAMGAPIDGRADLYSLGVILYELIVGRRPFDGSNLTAILRAIVQDTPAAPSQVDPFIPQALSDLIMKSLSRNPDDRFQTGSDMAMELKKINVGEPGEEPSSNVPHTKKKPAIMWVAVPVVVLFLVGGGWYYFTSKTESQASKEELGAQVPTGDTELAESTETITKLGPNVVVETSEEKQAAEQETALQADLVPTRVEASEQGTETTAMSEDESAPATDEQVLEQTAESSLTMLMIKSSPSGAQVFIENVLKGLTPIQVELPLGEYHVRVNLANHYEWKAELEINEEGDVPLHVKLAPAN